MPTSHRGWFDWITVAAIIAGPVLALFARRVLHVLREKKKNKLRTGLYHTLMRTRNNIYSPEHLQALNSIDFVFKDSQKIRNAWKAVLDQASTPFDVHDNGAVVAWNYRLLTLRVDLYQIIGQELGFDHSADYIKRGIYSPRLLTDVDEEWHKVRRGLAQAVDGDSLSVSVVEADAPYGPDRH